MPMWLKITAPALMVIFLTFGVLLATGVIKFSSLFKTSVEVPEGYTIVPNIEGADIEEATTQLMMSNLNYTTGGNVTSEYIAANLIVYQDPEGGRIIPINSLVAITVSRGNGEVIKALNGISTVPIFVWSEEAQAIEDFTTAGLRTTIEYIFDENVAAGQVIRAVDLSGSDITAGTELPEGTEVILYVSKGPEGFSMPNVIGYTESDAKSMLEQKGLIVFVSYVENSNASAGTVFDQSVAADTNVKLGTEITLSVAIAGATPTETPKSIFATNTPTPSPTPLPELTVTFDSNGGSSVSAITRTYGNSIGTLPTPTKEGHTFDGWIYNGSTISASTTVTSNMTVIASWTANTYTVTFDSNGGSSVSSISRTYGETIGSLPSTAREGYTFNGWTYNGSNASFDTAVYSNMTLTASWTINTYTVTFDSNGGSIVSSTTYTHGETLGNLPEPDRTGYTFDGWTSGGSYVSSSTMVTSDITLTASWTINVYTIEFNSAGGSSVSSFTREYGSTLGNLSSPKRDYYTFAGWYYDGDSVSSNTVVTDDMTLTASWSENDWGPWSDWSTDYAENEYSDGIQTVEVRTNVVPATYKTQYHYERFYGPDSGWYYSWPVRTSTCTEWEQTEWLDSPLPYDPNEDEYVQGENHHCYGDHYDNYGNYSNERRWHIPWYRQTTRTVEATSSYTEYQYRKRIK